MGSTKHQIILIFIYLINISIQITNTFANPNQLHEERNEFQIQRSSKVYGSNGYGGQTTGGSGYYNSKSGNYDSMNSDLDSWTHKHMDEVQGMAEKLRSQYNSVSNDGGGRGYYRTSRYSSSVSSNGGSGHSDGGGGCTTTGCTRLSSTTGKTQIELDRLAAEMTEQIIADMQSGKLVRSQINQPNWFENRVAEKLQSINKQKQSQAAQYGNYDSDAEILQQQHQSIFDEQIDNDDNDDGGLQQVQQNVFDHHTQHQQQGNFYQHQTQQQSFGTFPSSTGRDSKHSIYSHLDRSESEIMPNYRPRVVIDKNTQFQTLDTQQWLRPEFYHHGGSGMNREHIDEENYDIQQSYKPYILTPGATNVYAPFQIITYKSNTTRERPYSYYPDDSKFTTEKHNVQTNVLSVVPKTNFNILKLSSEDYEHRLRQTQDILKQLGYDRLSALEYNTTISAEGFTHNGYKYSYDAVTGKYEKGSRLEISEQQYKEMIGNIRNQLTSLGIGQLTDEEYRQIIASGIFIQNGVQWNYNQDTGRFENEKNIQDYQNNYRTHLGNFQQQLKTLGYNQITEEEYNETITTGYFIRGGSKWHYDYSTGHLEHIQLPAQDHRIILMRLQDEFRRLGYKELTEQEYNQVIKTGICIRNGMRWSYNAQTGKYERGETNDEEYRAQLRRLKEQLHRLGYNQITDKEYHEIIRTGIFTHGGDKWVYNFQTNQLEKDQLDGDRYRMLIRNLQDYTKQLGYNHITEEEFNETITTGVFIRGGNKWNYNIEMGRLEKVEFPEHQHRIVLMKLQDELRRYGYDQMTTQELNQVLKTGVFIRDGMKWSYDAKLGKYIQNETTNDEYLRILHNLQNQFNRLGYNQITEKEYNETIRSGVFIRGGDKWIYDFQTGNLEKVQLDTNEYQQMLHKIQDQLHRMGYNQITEEEYNQTITSGIFIRGGDKFKYDFHTNRFEKIQLPESEHRIILLRLQDELRRLGFKQMTDREYEQTIKTGNLIRDGVKWSYDAKTGRYEEKALTAEEYQRILDTIRTHLYHLGYKQISDEEYNQTITTGYFIRGGDKYHYDFTNEQFEKENLTEEQHRIILMQLQNEFKRLGLDQLTQTEYNQAMTTGEIIRGGIKWTYDAKSGRYEQTHLTEDEYRIIMTKLQHELRRLGYNQLTEKEYDQIIKTGVFIRGGDKWVYETHAGQLQKVQLTEQDYHTILNRIENQLAHLGFNQLTADEYNQTIKTGVFIHGGDKWQYNYQTDRFEKIELSEDERRMILQRLESELRRLGYDAISAREFNETMRTGVFIRGGNKWSYDAKTGRYIQDELTETDYSQTLLKYQDALRQLGYNQLTEKEYNETITSGVFIHGGDKWHYNYETGRFDKIQLTEAEHRVILMYLQNELKRSGYDQMTEEEFNNAIKTGVFIRGTIKYTYDAKTGHYVKNELTEQEHNAIMNKVKNALARLGIWEINQNDYQKIITTGEFIYEGKKYKYDHNTGRLNLIEITTTGYNNIINKLRDTLTKLGYRQMTEREFNDTITTGQFVRGGYQWKYDIETGDAHKIRAAHRQEEISDQEYREIYKRLQATLKRIGYRQMSDSECENAISSGTFTRGGNQWLYNPAIGQFERVELSDTEYKQRLIVLMEELRRIGSKQLTHQLTEKELREIILKGYFTNGGYRWEYNSKSGRFERLEITPEEYHIRLTKLREQLKRMNYGEMSDGDCEKAIYNGFFHYGGYKWVYNFDTGYYEMAERSNYEEKVGPGGSTIEYDKTKYDSSNKNKTHGDGATGGGGGGGGMITWTGRPKPIISKNRGDQPPQHFEEDYESEEVIEQEPGIGYYPGNTKKPEIGLAPPPSTVRPSRYPPLYTAPLAQYETATTSIKYEQHTIVPPSLPPALNQQGYESRYETSRRTYTKTSATVPSNRRNYQADQSYNSKQTTVDDLGQQQEDLTQKFIDFGQETEDLTQQQEDLTQQQEDLTQQEEDFTQQLVNFGKENDQLTQQQEDLTQQLIGFDDGRDQHQHTQEQKHVLQSHQSSHFGTEIEDLNRPHEDLKQNDEGTEVIADVNQVVEIKPTEKAGFFKRIASSVKNYVG